MSFHLTNQVWQIELRGMQKLVLLALSHLATQSTGECSVSVRHLAYICGISDSAVRDQVGQLVAAGHVEKVDGAGKDGYRVKVGLPT